LGIKEADHEESSPDGSTLLINRLECDIAGQTRKIKLIPKTNSAKAYGRDEVIEQFRCNFGLNPAFRDEIFKGPLQVAGVDENGEVRIIISFLKASTAFHNLRSQ
jgi:CTP synthase (UTP-ammonia lyase)